MEDKNIQKKKKVLYGFGDSLVEGHCINIGMLDRLAEKNGMKYQKYARNGVCQKWSISHVDIYRYGQINTCIDEMRKKYSYDTAYCLTDGNGTHLNAQGYERWYLPEIEDAMRKYL